MEIKAARGTYRVEFRNTFSEVEQELSSDKYHAILFDEKLHKLNLISSNFLSTLPSLGIEASEKSKSYLEVNRVLEWFSENSLNRNSMVLVIGGGAIQDIATFACSIFHRGINWTYVPTTLLSQSDSSIGGKCGINLQNNKNQMLSIRQTKFSQCTNS
jgi:3-dehydroquinate synthase